MVFRNFFELRNMKFNSDWIFEMSMRLRFRQYMGLGKFMSELKNFYLKEVTDDMLKIFLVKKIVKDYCKYRII